jgi:8-oxo-dGTP diphosphatase
MGRSTLVSRESDGHNDAEVAVAARSGARVFANVTSDLVVLTVRESKLKVLLVVRQTPPFKGSLALPGGFVLSGEDLEAAALRRITEETGIGTDQLHFEQVKAYFAPGRDPRGPVITVSFLAIAPNLPMPVAGEGAESADWFEVTADLMAQLAFDHDMILRDAVERARSLLENTTIATTFCGAEFTIGELQKVYEIVWGRSVDSGNFRRKVMKTKGFVEEIGVKRIGSPGRPPELYRRGPAQTLYPPVNRSTSNSR